MTQRRPRHHDEKHLAFIRERSCVICGRSPVHAAHIKMPDARVGKQMASNIGMKADDFYVLPLCPDHHGDQHDVPERSFWENHGIDPVLLALQLYAFSKAGLVERADGLIYVTMLSTIGIRQ